MFLIRIGSVEEIKAINKYFENKNYRVIPRPIEAYNSYKKDTTLFVHAVRKDLSFSSFKFYTEWYVTKDLPIVKITAGGYRRF